MTHKLLTPLSGVVGVADLLQDAELPADQRDQIRLLRSGATTLLGLVTDFRDYTRMEAGRTSLPSTLQPVSSACLPCKIGVNHDAR